jgi:MoxR-like ATPase
MKTSIPILIVGAPGTGKTASIEAQYGYVEKLLTSTITEEDISGLPYRKGEYDYRTIPSMFRRLEDADKAGKSTCLFLDEIDKARRSVADTLLTLVCSRKVGEASLPQATDIIAAANPPEFGGGDGISPAMLSRFAVIDFVPDPAKWADWAQRQFSTSAAVSVINAVRYGEMPIIDVAGEGLAQRITSPRTIAYSLQIIEAGKDVDRLVSGLLTASSASQILMIARNARVDVYQAANDVRRRAIDVKTVPVLRLP